MYFIREKFLIKKSLKLFFGFTFEIWLFSNKILG